MLLTILTIVIGSMSFNIINERLLDKVSKDILILSVQYYTSITYILLFAGLFVVTLILFIFTHKKYKKKNSSTKVAPFFILLISCQILTFGGIFFVKGDMLNDITLIKKDLDLYYNGDLSIYSGNLSLDAHQTNRKKHYYYINSDDNTYKIATDMYSGHQLLQDSYTIKYLPNTNTITQLYDSSMLLHSGSETFTHPGIDSSHWQYEDLLISKSHEVYGYDELTDAAQKAFDLIYGEYFYTPSLEEKYTFALPESIDFDEYVKILELYWSNNIHYDSNDYRYSTDSTSKSNISSFYIVKLDNDKDIDIYMEKVDQILAEIPSDISDYEKILYICTYLVDNIEYYNGDEEIPPHSIENDLNNSSTKDKPYITGQGALFDGFANCLGYTKALDTLLRRSGFTTIPIFGSTPGEGHAWNMVRLDDEWYHLDTTWMDNESGIDYTYFLADDKQMESTHISEKYAYCNSIEIPKANGTKYNWFNVNDLYFETAEEALSYINSKELLPNKRTQIKLSSVDEYEKLYDYFTEGLGGNIKIHYSKDLFSPSSIVSFTKIS